MLEGLYTTKTRGKKYPVRASWTPEHVYISGTIMKKTHDRVCRHKRLVPRILCRLVPTQTRQRIEFGFLVPSLEVALSWVHIGVNGCKGHQSFALSLLRLPFLEPLLLPILKPRVIVLTFVEGDIEMPYNGGEPLSFEPVKLGNRKPADCRP